MSTAVHAYAATATGPAPLSMLPVLLSTLLCLLHLERFHPATDRAAPAAHTHELHATSPMRALVKGL